MKIINLINEKLVVPMADRYMGTSVMNYLAQITRMSELSAAEVRVWQNQQLQLLIQHAVRNSPYYHELFQKLRLIPDDIRDIADLKKIPVLTKQIIHRNYNQFIPENIDKIAHRNAATGGSSGDPLQYLIDKRSFSFATAVRYFYMTRIGYRLGDPILVLGGRSVSPDYRYVLKYRIYHLLNRKIMLSSINMSVEILDRYIKIIAGKKIKYIFGSPSALFLLACRIEKQGISLPRIRAIISTSEMLPDAYREKIKSVFGCGLMDVYGAGDGGVTAYEVAEGIYHVGYNSYVEIEDDGSGKNRGSIIVTDLLNYAFPFIRYRLGDYISLTNRNAYAYNGQVIADIWGRNSDIMRLENGVVLTGKGWPTLFSKLNVKAYRIRKIGVMHIECEIQKKDSYCENDENLIRRAFKKHAGDDCSLKITYVDQFYPLPNGKFNFFISDTA